MAVLARFPILVEAARGDAEGDAWRERCDAARRGFPAVAEQLPRVRGLAGKLLMERFIDARVGPCRRRRRACHEHPDKDARNGERCSWGTYEGAMVSDCSGTRATRETVRP